MERREGFEPSKDLRLKLSASTNSATAAHGAQGGIRTLNLSARRFELRVYTNSTTCANLAKKRGRAPSLHIGGIVNTAKNGFISPFAAGTTVVAYMNMYLNAFGLMRHSATSANTTTPALSITMHIGKSFIHTMTFSW